MMVTAVLANNYPIWFVAQLAAIAILAILFLRWRPGFLRGRTIGESLGQALDAREHQINAQLEAAQQSREEAARIHEQSEMDIAAARSEAETIVARAAETGEAIQREVEQRAREEYERITGQAKAQIEYERQQAELALRRRAADIVIDAAREIVDKNLGPDVDRRIIDDSLSNLGRQA